jgi:hypothetical protein
MVAQGDKAVEGGEELVVPADAGGGNEAAHGERVYQRVVERLALEGAGRGQRAGWARRLSVEHAGILHKHALRGIDAQPVRGRILQKCLGVGGAGEVHMEVGPLGHLLQKRVQRERPGAPCGIEGGGGADFAGGRSGLGRRAL